MTLLLTPLAWLLAIPAQETPPVHEDPHPPEVSRPAGEPATARPYPELVSHQAPRPRAAGAVDEDWPTFLGPRRDAHTRETKLADFGSSGPPLLWEFHSGQGYASPVVAEGRLIYTHRQEREVHVDCLDPETGQRYWRHSSPCEYRDRYIANEGPRSTPAIHAGRVYVHSLENDLLCLDLATGAVLWRRALAREFALQQDFFGVVSSPLVHDSRLIVNLGAPGGPCVAAFDLESGRLVWGAGKQWGASCASPVVARVGGRERLFVLAGGDSRPPTGGLLILDPGTGAIELEYDFRSKIYESVTGASPVPTPEGVLMTSSYGAGSTFLGLDEEGAFVERWSDRHLGLQFTTPVFEQGHLWAIDGKADRSGELVCLDPTTGEHVSRTELIWDESFEYRGEKRTQAYTVGEGSLLWADGRLLCLGDNGHLMWIRPDPQEPTVLSRAWLFRANESWTPPVVSHGLLYLRQTKPERFGDSPPRLLCYDLRAD